MRNINSRHVLRSTKDIFWPLNPLTEEIDRSWCKKLTFTVNESLDRYEKLRNSKFRTKF